MTVLVGRRGPGHRARVAADADGGSNAAPDAFGFAAVTAAALETIYESEPATVLGMGAPADLDVVGGECSVNGGAWSAAPTTVSSGDEVRVRGISANAVGTATQVTVTIGGVAASFSITTVVNAETSALALRFTSDPGSTRRGLIDGLVGALKTGGVWDRLDILCLLAAHDSQAARQNWKQDLHHLTAVGGPAFTPDRGYAGDGVAAYLDTNFADNTAGGNWSLNSATVGVWVNVDGGGTTPAVGVLNTSSSAVVTPLASGSARGRIHGTAQALLGASTRLGWTCAMRNSATEIVVYRGTTASGVNPTASSSQSATNICLLRNNSTYAADRLAAFALGALNATEHATLVNALGTYLGALGAD